MKNKKLKFISMGMAFAILLYSFSVQAIVIGTGASQSGSFPPLAPSGYSVVAGVGQNTLHPGTASGATSYNAYYTFDSSTPTTANTKITGVTDGQVQASLTNGYYYNYVFTAQNISGESSPAAATGYIIPQPASGLADSFTAANGTAFVASLWSSLTWSGQGGSSYFNIRSSKAEVYLSTTSGTGVGAANSIALPFSTGKSFTIDTGAMQSETSGNVYLGLMVTNSGVSVNTGVSAVQFYLAHDNTNQCRPVVGYYSAAGAWNSLASGSLSSANCNAHTVVLTFPSTSSVGVTIDGSNPFGSSSYAFTGGLLGSNVVFTMRLSEDYTGAYIAQTFDNILIQ